MPYFAVIYTIIILFGCLLSLFKHPYWGILAYLVVYILNPVQHWWGLVFAGCNIQTIIVLIVLFSIFIHKNKVNFLCIYNKYNIVLLIFFTNMLFVNTFLSLNIFVTYEYTEKFFKILLIYFLIQLCFIDILSIKKFFDTFLACFIYLSIDAINYFSGSRLDDYGLTDANDANTLALVAVFGIIIAFSRINFFKNMFASLIYFAISIPLINLLAMTKSRGAFLGIVSACLWMIFSFKHINKIYIYITLCIFSITFYYISDQNYLYRIFTTLNYEQNSMNLTEASAGRYGIWQSVPELLSKYPFGIGSGNFYDISPYVLPVELLEEGGRKVLHNTYLQALLELNIFGFILYIFFLCSIIFDLKKYKNILLKKELYDYNTVNFIHYSSIFEIILITYTVMSFFLDRLYFELSYLLFSLSIVLILKMKEHVNCKEFK